MQNPEARWIKGKDFICSQNGTCLPAWPFILINIEILAGTYHLPSSHATSACRTPPSSRVFSTLYSCSDSVRPASCILIRSFIAMLFVNIIVCFGIIGVTDAFPSTTYAVKERHTVPRSWTKIGPSSKRDTIHLQIGLKQQNDGIIEQKLLENSNPKHENYGKHLSRDEVIAIITPSEDTLHLVQSWLDDHGIKDYFHNTAKDMIHCEVAIEKAEQLLQTSYSTYRHKDGSELNRAPEWSLPQHLHEHIDIIQPTTSFFHPKKEVVSDSSAWHPVTWWDKSGQQDYPKAWAGSSGGGYGSPYGGQGGPVTKPQGALGQPVPQQSGQGGQAGGSQQQQQQGHGRPDVSNVCDLSEWHPLTMTTLFKIANCARYDHASVPAHPVWHHRLPATGS